MRILLASATAKLGDDQDRDTAIADENIYAVGRRMIDHSGMRLRLPGDGDLVLRGCGLAGRMLRRRPPVG